MPDVGLSPTQSSCLMPKPAALPTAAPKTIGDFFTLRRGMTYKSRFLGDPGPVLLGLASIHRNGGFRADSLQTYGGECPENLLVQPGELYVSLKDVTQAADLLGAVAMLPSHQDAGRLTQDTVKLEPTRSTIPLNYIYWLLRTPEYRDYCRAHATGTTNLRLSRADFLAFPVPPATPERLRLVDVLAALDDKIELNRRLGATLEVIARALFRSWFVDFDPVRAKMEGRDTQLPKDVADLFPDRMVSSELGEIPVGWEVRPLKDLLDLAYGNALKTDSRRHDGNVPVYGSKGRVGWHDSSLVQGPGIVVGRKGNPGAVTWVPTDFFPIDTTFYVVPKDNNYTWHFLFFALKAQDLPAIASDSVIPGLNRNLAYTNKQVVPPSQIAKHFEGYVGPVLTRNYDMGVESLLLASLRDTLLPRLVSGDLRQKDANNFLRQGL